MAALTERWSALPKGVRQGLWFAGLWVASVTALTVVAGVIRMALGL